MIKAIKPDGDDVRVVTEYQDFSLLQALKVDSELMMLTEGELYAVMRYVDRTTWARENQGIRDGLNTAAKARGLNVHIST